MGNKPISKRSSLNRRSFLPDPPLIKPQLNSPLHYLLKEYFELLNSNSELKSSLTTLSRDIIDQEDVDSIELNNHFSLNTQVFIHLIEYLNVEEIYTLVGTVCKKWYCLIHCDKYDETIWKRVSMLHEKRQVKDHNFPGSVFSCQGYIEYLENHNTTGCYGCCNPVYANSRNWRNYCMIARMYCKICEECFKRAFTGHCSLFAGADSDIIGKCTFIGPPHCGTTTLVQSVIQGRKLEANELYSAAVSNEKENKYYCLLDQSIVMAVHCYDFNTKGAVVKVLAFDLSSEDSLNSIIQNNRYKKLVSNRNSDNRYLLIGLKSDVKESDHITSRALLFAVTNNMFYIECSSVLGENIDTVSRMIAVFGYFVLMSRMPKTTSA
jgi:hypothetical protein